jgi:hypothetical protein
VHLARALAGAEARRRVVRFILRRLQGESSAGVPIRKKKSIDERSLMREAAEHPAWVDYQLS